MNKQTRLAEELRKRFDLPMHLTDEYIVDHWGSTLLGAGINFRLALCDLKCSIRRAFHKHPLIQWIQKVKHIIKYYELDQRRIAGQIQSAEQIIRERTEINVELNTRGDNHIVMVGRYRNRDYVETITVDARSFDYMVRKVRELEQFGRLNRIDGHPGMRATFEHLIRGGDHE